MNATTFARYSFLLKGKKKSKLRSRLTPLGISYSRGKGGKGGEGPYYYLESLHLIGGREGKEEEGYRRCCRLSEH